MPVNPLTNNNFIDSCAFDPKYEPEDRASIEIFILYKEGKLPIQIAHSTQKEIDHPNTPAWVKREALNLIYTIPVQLTEGEVRKLREIETILAGDGKVENVRQDARHVFEAQKYGSYFVTTDSRILDRAVKLHKVCNVIVLKPSLFLSLVKERIEKQDNEHAHLFAKPVVIRNPELKTKMDSALYNGYLIQAAPYRLADSGEWTIDIIISHDNDGAVNFRNFHAANTFKTEEEAILHCIDFGRQIIDGKFETCWMADL